VILFFIVGLACEFEGRTRDDKMHKINTTQDSIPFKKVKQIHSVFSHGAIFKMIEYLLLFIINPLVPNSTFFSQF
jgi:hypothetical protein